MIDVKKNRFVKYPLFGTLYFSQGLIYALATVIINLYLGNKGIDTPIIAIVIAIAYIPWVLKFIFGGIVDHFYKITRRTFIIFGGVLSAISLLIVSFIDPSTNLICFSFFIFLGSSGIAFLDVAADAWAIEISEERERGKVNGAMFSGLFIGAAISSIVMSSIGENYGYSYSFIVSALLILVIIIFPILVKDTSIRIRKSKVKKLLVKEFKKKNTQLIAIFLPFICISFGMLGIILPRYLDSQLLLSDGTIGLIMALGLIGTILGNIIGGFMADHWGRKNSLYVFIGLLLIFATSLVFASTLERIIVIWFIVGFLHGSNHSVIGALSMDITNPRIGATQYSLLMACGNAGEMTGTAISGTMICALGFTRTFLYSGLVYGPALLILHFIKSNFKVTKKKK